MNSTIKLDILSGILAVLVTTTGCTHQLSQNITKQGTVENANDLVFPNPENAWIKDGTFINKDNLAKVKAGISKDDLYQLLGAPHFNESQYASEWDYRFKFYQSNGQLKYCQYKIIFDKDYKAQQFYWQPKNCKP